MVFRAELENEAQTNPNMVKKQIFYQKSDFFIKIRFFVRNKIFYKKDTIGIKDRIFI